LDPYVPRISSSALLERLHRRRLVRRDGPRFYLPRQPDGAHILQLIPEGEIGDGMRQPPPTTQVALSSRAADYFADVQRHRTSADDLSAGFAEIELRLQAQEDDKVLDLMAQLTQQHLAPSGSAIALNPWRRRLRERLGPTYDAVHNLSQIANAHLAVGEPQHALETLTEAHAIADEFEAPEDYLELAIQLGDASFDIGDTVGSSMHYERALHDAEDADLPFLQAQARLGLMQCGAETADFAGALAHYDAGMEIADGYGLTGGTSPRSEEAHGLRRTAGRLLLQASLLEATLGRFSPALRAVRRGSRIARELKETRLAGAYLVAEAVIRTDIGELDMACALATQATEVALQVRNPQLAREAGATLARGFCAGNVSAAEKAARQAARSFQDPRSMGALTLYGLTLLRAGNIEAAHRAFSRAEAHGRAMIDRDWRGYDIQDYQGLAVSGLIRCGDNFRIESALSSYRRAARNTTEEERVIRRSIRLLRQLTIGADAALRERLLTAAAGGLYEAI
jgi:tetratricopeptide (TPR) repeat protein